MSRTITPADHAWFTGFSGDANPLHDDPIASRRLLGGRMLVHGAHLLLRSLDHAVATGAIGTTPARVRVLFRHGIAPGDPLESRVSTDGASVTVTITRPPDGREVATVTLDPSTEPVPAFEPEPQDPARPVGPRPLDVAGLAELVGRPQPPFRPPVDPHGCAAMFPAATRVLGAGRVSEIASISFVVGMLTPGRSSMSSSYHLRWEGPADGPVEIHHTLDRFDPRLRRARLTVSGPSMRATVTAFIPPAPADQRAALAGRQRPTTGEFGGWRALVVGGSRGLGEAAARLLAAGGADVRITWAACEADARRVAGDLGAHALRWRAPVDDPGRLDADGWAPTHLCWFASPSADDDPEAEAVEITAFERAVGSLRGSLTAALWPSTALLDVDPDGWPRAAADFVARKRTGEDACRAVGAHAARLPTLLTDRTQALLPREYGDTAHELLRALRAAAATRLLTAPGRVAGGSDTVARHE